MTHTSNYARDRLALLLFDTAFKFIKQWTKLELLTEEPVKLANRYFNIFPGDKVPLWEVSVILLCPLLQPIIISHKSGNKIIAILFYENNCEPFVYKILLNSER